MPHIEDVGNPERTVLEEMRSLAGDLEWVMVIKEVCVERSRCHRSVLRTTTHSAGWNVAKPVVCAPLSGLKSGPTSSLRRIEFQDTIAASLTALVSDLHSAL